MTELHIYRIGSLIRGAFRLVTRGRWMPLAVTIGYTVVYLVAPTETTRRHELAHVRQARQLGRLRFWWRYLRELRRSGYRSNLFEIESRRAAGEE